MFPTHVIGVTSLSSERVSLNYQPEVDLTVRTRLKLQ
jgi:hypothetical protein